MLQNENFSTGRKNIKILYMSTYKTITLFMVLEVLNVLIGIICLVNEGVVHVQVKKSEIQNSVTYTDLGDKFLVNFQLNIKIWKR